MEKKMKFKALSEYEVSLGSKFNNELREECVKLKEQNEELKKNQLSTEGKFLEALDYEAFRVPYDGSNNFYDDDIIKHYKKCYRFIKSLTNHKEGE